MPSNVTRKRDVGSADPLVHLIVHLIGLEELSD